MSRVPAAPIRHLIQEWLEESKENSLARLGRILFPDLSQSQADSKARNLMRVRAGTDSIDFDLADLVLCRLNCPELWLEDESLYNAYMQADLKTLDKDRPTVADAA